MIELLQNSVNTVYFRYDFVQPYNATFASTYSFKLIRQDNVNTVILDTVLTDLSAYPLYYNKFDIAVGQIPTGEYIYNLNDIQGIAHIAATFPNII